MDATSLLTNTGYRGREVDGARILHRGKPKRMSKTEKRLLKRRPAVKPSIGHLKADHRMRRMVIFWCWILSVVLRLLDQGGSDARSDLASAAA